MAMKLAKLKALFHPAWDLPEDEVEVRFLAPGVGGKWEMEIGDNTYFDVANKLWTVNMKITGPIGEPNDVLPAEGAPVTHVDKSSEGIHTHDETDDG